MMDTNDTWILTTAMFSKMHNITTEYSVATNDTVMHDSNNDSAIFVPTTSPAPGSANDTAVLSEELDCTATEYTYDPAAVVMAVSVFIFGVLFCIFGYRCFKAVLFVIGFLFGLVIVFLICQEEDLLPQYGNIGISALSGFLYGLICLLVPYVGFFTLGFHSGLLLGLASLIFFPAGHSIWISIIFLLGAGLFGAVANVCFPSLTLLTTSLIGSAGISLCFDYFVEKLKAANWIWAHIKEKQDIEFCWFTWLMLSLWPAIFMMGIIIQYTLTSRGFTIYAYPYKKRQPPRRRMTREERALARQAKYRYLYQVRTAGGDILSQSYVEAVQKKAQADTLSTHMSTLPIQDETQTQEE